MAIMTCPRCGGCGAIWNSQEGTACAGYSSTCPSCGGKGYVTDDQCYGTSSILDSDTKYTFWPNPIITREPERIGRVLSIISEVWHRFPDWRLSQLLISIAPFLDFYTEDTVLEERLNKFCEDTAVLDKK